MNQVIVYKGSTNPDGPKAPEVTEEIETFGSDSDSEFFQEEEFSKESSNPSAGSETSSGWIAYSVTGQACLYYDKKLLKVIRMYPVSSVNILFPGCTKKNLNNIKHGLGLGAYRIASLKLKAINDKNVYPMFGAEHETTMFISTLAKADEMAAYFRDEEIKIASDDFKYKLVPGSFKIKPVKSAPEEIA